MQSYSERGDISVIKIHLPVLLLLGEFEKLQGAAETPRKRDVAVAIKTLESWLHGKAKERLFT